MNAKALCTVLIPVLTVGGMAVWPRSKDMAPPLHPASLTLSSGAGSGNASAADAQSAPEAPAAPVEFIELHTAIEQGIIQAQFIGNGRERMNAVLTNTGTVPFRVQADAGQMLDNGRNSVVVMRSTMVEVAAGGTAEMALPTCATRSSNRISEMEYKLSYHKVDRLQDLMAYAAGHLELTPAAMQTAALALLENLPLSAVARFTPAAGELKSRFNTDAFRVEPIDIICALAALREMGVPDDSIAMTVDPQLKIEAMIEPLSRAAAMRYYGIPMESEWDYWKTELLSGAPVTRHYALYGIARFYPDIALEMLPKWARETRTNPLYRIAALQALADTQRSEASPMLRMLADELGFDSELGRAATGAADALDYRLAQLAERQRQQMVAFRASKTVSQF